METTKYKLKYQGVANILLDCHGFSGRVAPGDVIEVFKAAVDELRGHNEWVLITEKKTKNGGDE